MLMPMSGLQYAFDSSEEDDQLGAVSSLGKSVYRAGVRAACNPSPSVNEADDSVQSISKCGGTDDLQPILTSIRPKTKGSTFRHGFSI